MRKLELKEAMSCPSQRFSISRFTRALSLALFVNAIVMAGCGPKTLPGDYGSFVEFKDDLVSNAEVDPAEVAKMTLIGSDGAETKLNEIAPGKNLLLVVSRGLIGSLQVATPTPATEETSTAATGSKDSDSASPGHAFCIYCSTQTSRLVANYAGFLKRNTEVVVVFPVAGQEDAYELQNFAAKVQGAGKTSDDFPFPVLLDVKLAVVDALGIRDDLSKPATYIFDSQGQLQFAYVGQSISDRPSIKALFEQIDRINQR